MGILFIKILLCLYNKLGFITDVHYINIRSKGLLTCPTHKTAMVERSFKFDSYKLYNVIPFIFKQYDLHKFKKTI